MKQTYINQLRDHIGETVTLKGWLYTNRLVSHEHHLRRLFLPHTIDIREAASTKTTRDENR